MIEKVKSATLWLLILSSVVLTYLIWTYQPSVGIIEETEYYTSDRIGEERRIIDVIKPREIIIHEKGQSFLVPSTEDTYKEIFSILRNSQFSNFSRSSNSEAPSLYRQMKGIEIIFSDQVREEWMKPLLGMELDDYFPLRNVDRMNLFINDESDETEVTIRFYSFSDREIYETNIDISEKSFNALYKDDNSALIEVMPTTFKPKEGYFRSIYYVPTERPLLPEYTYYSDTLSQEAFKQYLFPDPEFVKSYLQGNNEETYTDGSRMINIVEKGEVLRYIHATGGLQRGEDESTILDASINFINSHAGWIDDYFLDSWQETPTNERIKYRLHVNELPVMGVNSLAEEYYLKELTKSNGQITDYNRSLLQFTEEVFTTEIDLLTYDEVTEILNTNESFETSVIDDIRIGYFMHKQDSFVIFEPCWFVKDRGSWRQIQAIDGEVDSSGLE